MIALRVTVNGEHLCIAGAEDMAVFNTIVSAVGNTYFRRVLAKSELTTFMNQNLNWLEIPIGRIETKRDAISAYVNSYELIQQDQRRWFPKYPAAQALKMHAENLKNLAFMLGINLKDPAIDPKGRADRDDSVFDLPSTG